MKTSELIKSVLEKGSISEREILLLKRRINNGENIDLSDFYVREIEIETEQVEKGKKWLLNQWKSPLGKERKNNPFGYREQDVISDLQGFLFLGFYDVGNQYAKHNEPLYMAYSKNNTFEYYVNGGKINIIG